MALKAAFLFIAPEVNPNLHRHTIITPAVELTVVAVNDYDEAISVSKSLVDNGVTAIELCGGFGVIGTGRIAEAVHGKASVGVIRFDAHPGLEFKSGDDVFAVQKIQDF